MMCVGRQVTHLASPIKGEKAVRSGPRRIARNRKSKVLQVLEGLEQLVDGHLALALLDRPADAVAGM